MPIDYLGTSSPLCFSLSVFLRLGWLTGITRRKAEKATAADVQQWKKIDRDALGEGQYFGKNLRNLGTTEGSIREGMSRPGTSASMRGGAFRSPYGQDSRSSAAASMFDLSRASHAQNPSFSSLPRPSLSDAHLRTNFSNGSSLSLAPRPWASPPPALDRARRLRTEPPNPG